MQIGRWWVCTDWEELKNGLSPYYVCESNRNHWFYIPMCELSNQRPFVQPKWYLCCHLVSYKISTCVWWKVKNPCGNEFLDILFSNYDCPNRAWSFLQLSMKCRVLDIYTGIQTAYDTILHNWTAAHITASLHSSISFPHIFLTLLLPLPSSRQPGGRLWPDCPLLCMNLF